MNFFLYLVLLVATYLRPVELLFPEAAPYRPMIWVSLLALLVAVAATATGERIAGSRRQFLHLLLLVLVVAGSLVANRQFGSLVDALIHFSPNILLYVLALLTINTMRRLKVALFVFVACIMGLSVAGVNAYHTGFLADTLVMKQLADEGEEAEVVRPESTEIPAADTSGVYLWRVTSIGLLADPNEFAQAIVVTLPLLAGLYSRRRHFRNLVVVVAPISFLSYTIFLTHSRGAILGLASVLFFGIRRAIGVVWTAALLVFAGVGVLATSFAGGRAFSTQEESASGRIDAWAEGLKMLISHPVLGVGYERFTEYNYLTAHNSFVLCFSELGLVGYVVWLGLIIVPIKEMNRCIAKASPGEDGRRWATLLLIAFIGFLTCSFFLSRTYAPGLYMLMSFCTCISYCSRIQTQTSEVPIEEPKWLRASVLIAISSVVMFSMIVRMR